MNDYLDLYLDYMVEEVQNHNTSNTRKQHIDEAKKTINDSKQTQKMIKKAIVLCLACIGLGIWLANNYANKKMYEQQVNDLKDTLNGLKYDNEELKRRVGALTNATNKLNASQNDTNSRVDDLESRSRRVTSKLKKMDEQLTELKDETKSTRETLKKLGRKVGQTVETLEKQKKTYENDREQFNKKMSTMAEHIKKQDTAIKATGQKASKAQRDSLGAATLNLITAGINKSNNNSERRALTANNNKRKKSILIDAF